MQKKTKIQRLFFFLSFSVFMLNCCPALSALPAVNIIPTPKSIQSKPGIIPLEKAIIILSLNPTPEERTAAAEINKAITKLEILPLSVKKMDFLPSADQETRHNLIVVGCAGTHTLLDRLLLQSKKDVPEQSGGYLITALPASADHGEIYLLAGRDIKGVLYAVASFKFLLSRQDDVLTASRAEISDWPDYAVRPIVLGSTMFENRNPAHKLSATAYEILDWCFDHKFNFGDITSYRISQANFTIPNAEITEELRQLNLYASERCFETSYHCFFTAVGLVSEDDGKPEFEGCIKSGGRLWCWSRDALIKRQVEKAAAFLERAQFKNVIFHSRDGSPTEYWRDRCQQCRDRFGDDRAAATANYINHAYTAVKERCPDMRLIFVTEPYYGNLNLPENQAYREFYAKLTELIPADVYLTNADWTRDSQESWKQVVRQPIFQWRNITVDFFRTGRLFTAEPALAIKSGWFPGSLDIPYVSGAQFYAAAVQPIMTMLMTQEFMWNVDAPGSVMLWEDPDSVPKRRVEDLVARDRAEYKPQWLWHHSSAEPESIALNLLPRLCGVQHGREAAEMMAEIYRMGISNRILLITGRLYTSPEYYSILRDPAVIYQQWKNAEKALEAMDDFKKAEKFFKPGIAGQDEFESLYHRFKKAASAGAIHYHILLSEIASQERNTIKAGEALLEAEKALEKVEEDKDFDQLRKAYETAEMRIMLLQMSADKPTDVIKVGLYNPLDSGGRILGHMPVYSTLMHEQNMHVEMLPALKNLDLYDCIVIPDCKAFGSEDNAVALDIEREIHLAEKAVRDYVLSEGGGVLFLHDSVGYARFPLGRSMFPELALQSKKVTTRNLFVNKEHPITAKHKIGETFEHMYLDHIAMEAGEKADILLTNQEGLGVIIAGTLEKGRVVSSVL